MSGTSAAPKKRILTERLRHIWPRSRASSPSPASLSTQALTSSATQSPGLPSTQILASSSQPSAQPAAAHHPNASAASSSRTSSSKNILEDALQRLSDSERATLQDYILPTAYDIDSALRQSLAAATEKQRYCIEKRWTFTFAGQKISLKEEADKVIRWLNRFKAVGDIAVNADPVHAGLPWAGIRLLLEAAVSEANQMACLLVGCENALYMANRLKAYMEFLLRLPVTITRTNFEGALTRLYTCILRFLSKAIQAYQTPALGRAFKAFWQDSEIQEFQKECDRLAIHAETEASNCDRTEKLRQDLHELENLRQIQASLNQIEIDLALGKLPFAKGSIFDAYDADHVTCHPATRVDILRQIQDWALHSQSKSIFWLNGMAGTGKSTISWTIAKWLTDQGHLRGDVDLGASFFFKRGEGDRGSTSRFFPTITRELISKLPGLDILVAEAIASNPLIFEKALGEQFDKLIYQPLQNVSASNCLTLVVVVDALDECEREGDIKAILDLWPRLTQITTVCLRLFLTSRPDLPILKGIKKLPVSAHEHMVLQDAVPKTTIQDDISTFLKDKFSKIREEYEDDRVLSKALGRDWPDDQVIQTLTDMATPLFIVAATVCRFIGDGLGNPRTRLEWVLKMKNIGAMSQMEKTYLPVLQQLSTGEGDSYYMESLYKQFREVVGSIVVLAEPLSIASLEDLLNMPRDDICSCLRPLHSVLRVPADLVTPVRTLHLSFREFLLGDKIQDKPFGVNGLAIHRLLLTKCLQLLSKGLRENICDLQYPGQPRQEVKHSIINERLTPALQYACRYWVYHTQSSKVPIKDDNEVHEFLRKHFLHWLEALSLIDRVAEVIKYVGILQSLVSVSHV